MPNTLRRGKTVEQFLGSNRDATSVRWIELRPTEEGVAVRLFDVLNPSKLPDIYDLGDAFEEPVAILSAEEAPAFAEAQLGAAQSKWVNQGIAATEYQDLLKGKRDA